jgi:hypothetical protein
MRIMAFAILAIGTGSIGPAGAQTYVRPIRFAFTCIALDDDELLAHSLGFAPVEGLLAPAAC